MEELLNKIGIKKKGHYSKNGTYVVDITDSQEFGKVYSMLEKFDDIEEIAESSMLTENEASIRYMGDDYQIDLLADFNQNIYRLVVINI